MLNTLKSAPKKANPLKYQPNLTGCVWSSSYNARIPYIFEQTTLEVIQKVYSKENRYVRTATQTGKGIDATVCVSTLLGITEKLSYVPASTISAIVSQCSALVLWAILRNDHEDPTNVYNLLVDNELVGFKSERPTYYHQIPLHKEIKAVITPRRIMRFHGNVAVDQEIILAPYMCTRILGFAFLGSVLQE